MNQTMTKPTPSKTEMDVMGRHLTFSKEFIRTFENGFHCTFIECEAISAVNTLAAHDNTEIEKFMRKYTDKELSEKIENHLSEEAKNMSGYEE